MGVNVHLSSSLLTDSSQHRTVVSRLLFPTERTIINLIRIDRYVYASVYERMLFDFVHWSVTLTDKKAQLSMTNPRDAKAC